MTTTRLVKEILQLTVYKVVSPLRVETRRTDRRAAEQDVHILKDIVRRSAWIEEE